MHHNEDLLQELNYRPILEKTKAILNSWSRRSLSIIGKTLIVNTLTASLFVYKMTALRAIDNNHVKMYDQLVKNFLWDGGIPKIKHTILQAPTHQGGLKLVNLTKKDQAIKISWVKIVTQDPEMANFAYFSLSPNLGELIWKCNLKQTDVKVIFSKPNMWTDVLEAWSRINYRKATTVTAHSQIIWLNSHIKINEKPILWKKCIQKGLIYVGQLYPNGSLLSAIIAMRTYELDIMSMNSIISALPKEWKHSCKTQPTQQTDPTLFEQMVTSDHIVALAYNILIDEGPVLEEKRHKWSFDLKREVSMKELCDCFNAIYKISNVIKMRSFQYRLLQRSVVTNTILKKWKILDTDLCSFCGRESETLIHLLVMCTEVSKLWIDMERFMMNYSDDEIQFNVDAVLLNKFIQNRAGHVKNTIGLITKQYIYRQRCLHKKLSSLECQSYVRMTEINEKYYAVKANRLDKHLKKWYPTVNRNNQSTNRHNEYIEEYIAQM